MNDDIDTDFEQWYNTMLPSTTTTTSTTEDPLRQFTNVNITRTIQLGAHTFSTQELGDLLNLLLQEHPELRI